MRDPRWHELNELMWTLEPDFVTTVGVHGRVAYLRISRTSDAGDFAIVSTRGDTFFELTVRGRLGTLVLDEDLALEPSVPDISTLAPQFDEVWLGK